MNLHAIASPYVAAVNPWLLAIWRQSKGYVTNADGRRAPEYATPVNVYVQWQAMSSNDLKQIDGLNINGTKNVLYINGDIDGVARPDARGGDLFTLPDGTIWMVNLVLENWVRTAGWTKAVVTQQNGS